MHVLVAYGSKMGGTKGIAKKVADTVTAEHFTVTLRSAGEMLHPEEFDAVILGSAIYATRWRREAVGLLKRLSKAGFDRPIWLFQSGPIDDDGAPDPPKLPAKVEKLSVNLEVKGRATFGGCLPEDATGFTARSMVKQGRSGDWRDFDQIEVWAKDIARDLGAQTHRE